MSKVGAVQAFASRVETLAGRVWVLEDRPLADAWRPALSALDPEGPGRLIVWDAPLVSGADLVERLLAWGYEPALVRPAAGGLVDAAGRPWDRERLKDAASRARIGISAGMWAVAHTGSVALYGDAVHGLWPSLLPPAHLIVLAHHTIYPTLGEGLRRLASEPGGIPPQVKLVTGPSSTGDIEGISVIGVHGPARLGVLVVNAENAPGV